ENARTEPLSARRPHRRTTAFLPAEIDTVRRQAPGDRHSPTMRRKRAIFHRVGAKLMQRYHQPHARIARDPDRWSTRVDGPGWKWLHRRSHEIGEITGPQVAWSEQFVCLRQRIESA